MRKVKDLRVNCPKNKLIYTSTEACRALAVSSRTFWKYLKELEQAGLIQRRKKRGSTGKFLTYDQVTLILQEIYRTPEQILSLRIKRKNCY